MLILKTLDVVIGIAFVFLLLSTLCATLREAIEARLKTRAAYLERGIRELLQDKQGTGIVKSLFEHPLLAGLYMGSYTARPLPETLSVLANGRGLPSYIPARSFALALLDLAGRGTKTDEVSTDPGGTPLTVESIRQRALNIESPAVRRVLLLALDGSRGDLDRARKSLEEWFDASMDRVSGWYKRSTHWVLFGTALCVTLALNIDTLDLATYLYRSDAARSALVERAEAALQQAQSEPKETGGAKVGSAKQALDSAVANLSLPLGWDEARIPSGAAWLRRILGWLVTAMAATLGAPFWFDVLNKVMVIRSTVKPREKSPDEASEDRQLRRRPAATDAQPALASGTQAVSPSEDAASQPVVFVPRDEESDLDGCIHGDGEVTLDEELPEALGGVA